MRWVITACTVMVIAGCAPRTIRVAPEPEAAPETTVQERFDVESVPIPQTSTEKRELFADAYRRFRADDCATAVPLFEILQPIYSELGDYLLQYLATCRLRQGDEDEAYRLWERLHAAYPPSLFTAEAALGRARILRRRGQLEKARELLGIAREDDLEQEVDWELAEIALAEGDLAEAHGRYMRVREAAPRSTLGRRAKQRVAELREREPSLTPTGDVRAAEVWLLVLEGDQQQALILAEQLLRQASDWERPQRLRALSDTQRAAGRFDEGMETLRSVYVDYPDSAAARGALHKYASILWNRDRDAEARSAFEEFRRRYPNDPSVLRVSYAIAQIKEASGQTDLAVADYSGLAEEYPRSQQGRDAAWRIAWIRYRQGRWKEAAARFARLERSSTGRDRTAAHYWQARSLEAGGGKNEARGMYRQILEADPTDYYALWAERRLGIQQPDNWRVDPPTTEQNIGMPPASTGGDFHLTRAIELQAADLRSLARAELKAFERSQPSTRRIARFLVDAYPLVDGYRDAIRLAPQAGDRSREILYPLAFWTLIRQHTVDNGIDPFMILALMRQESLFDPAARSPADARGLMQLLPSTAEQVAEKLGRPSPVDELYDPEVNVALGIAHLDELRALYGGNWLEILAAYNAGEAAVAKWQQRFATLDDDEFVESITYGETRDYVKKVLTHYRHYQRLYAGRDKIAARPSLAPVPAGAPPRALASSHGKQLH